MDFRVNDVAVGEPGSRGEISTLRLAEPGTAKVSFDVAAFLPDAKPTRATEAIRNRRLDQKPYWHIERSRLGQTRNVKVEVIVNGRSVRDIPVAADGSVSTRSVDIEIPHSSWVAVRIFPSVHTNPVFVEVAGKPIRASRKSAEWCLQAVDVCWNAKSPNIRAGERDEAKAAYDKARDVYAAVLREAIND
jgi:hypothetical protein